MSIKSIVVGFASKSAKKAIQKSIYDNLIDCKIWISNHNKYINNFKLADLFNMDIKQDNKNQYKEEYEYIFDKYFYTFVHSLSREKHIDFSYFEFVNLFTIQFYYFYNLIKTNEIKLLISTNFLHEADNLLYAIAKDIFKLDIIIFNQSLFQNRFWYANSIEDYGKFEAIKSLEKYEKTIFRLEELPEINLFYMKQSFKKQLENNCLYKFIFKDLEKIFNKRRNIKFYQQWIKFLKCTEYKANLKKYSIKDVDLSQKYVYFPLHLQPEMTTSIYGGKYADQLLALEKLSDFIPDDWFIYVKENPKQGYYQRDNLFFKRLSNIKKVKFIDKNYNTHILRENSQFLSTISGTAGWEAISTNKNVLLFGKAWYESLPGAFVYDDCVSFKTVANYQINQVELLDKTNDLLSNTFVGIVDQSYAKQIENYNDDENTEYIYNAINLVIRNLK